jgi:MSHA pilin protein MshD
MRRRQHGFTLIELVMYILIVGITVAGLSTLYVNSVARSSEPLQRERARTMASSYLEEILGKPWNENTPDGGGCVQSGSGRCAAYCGAFTPGSCPSPVCARSGPNCQPANSAASIGTDLGETTRTDFDDVDDYDGLNACPPTDATGSAVTGLQGYCATVSVSAPGASWNGIPAADALLIEVEVTTPGGEAIRLEAYRVNF